MMTPDSLLGILDAERLRLARAAKRGIGMPAAGMLFWVAMSFVLRRWPLSQALVVSFALTGMIFPVGVALTRLAGGNLFAKSEALTSLGLMLNFVQLLFWPVIIVVFFRAPEWAPFAMAILFGSHFLPYSWFYRSRGYAVLAVAPALVLTVAAIVTRDPLYLTVPLITAACYALAVGMLWGEVKGDAVA